MNIQSGQWNPDGLILYRIYLLIIKEQYTDLVTCYGFRTSFFHGEISRVITVSDNSHHPAGDVDSHLFAR